MKPLRCLLCLCMLLNLAPTHAQHENDPLEKQLAQYESGKMTDVLDYDAYMQYGTRFEDNRIRERAQAVVYRDKAIEAFKQALDKQPDDALAAFHLGTIAYREWAMLTDSTLTNSLSIKRLQADRVVEKDPKKKTASDAAFKEQLDYYKNINATLEPLSTAQLDETITRLTQAFIRLKDKPAKSAAELSAFNHSVALLAHVHAYKRDSYKGKDSNKYDEENLRVKQYKDLQEKLK